MPVVIGAFGAVSVNFKEYMKRIGVNVRLEVIQKNSIAGESKDTKESTVPVKRKKKEIGTCGDPLPRTINQAHYYNPAWI